MLLATVQLAQQRMCRRITVVPCRLVEPSTVLGQQADHARVTKRRSYLTGDCLQRDDVVGNDGSQGTGRVRQDCQPGGICPRLSLRVAHALVERAHQNGNQDEDAEMEKAGSPGAGDPRWVLQEDVQAQRADQRGQHRWA